MKRIIAIAALLLVAAPAQAKTPSLDEIKQVNSYLQQVLAAAKRSDFKTACTKYKTLSQYKLKTGGFNYRAISGSPKMQSLQRQLNDNTAKSNQMHNKTGADLCGKAGMKWINVSLPTAPHSQLSSVSSNIRNHCESRWGTDYRMIKYCVDKQTKAATSLGY